VAARQFLEYRAIGCAGTAPGGAQAGHDHVVLRQCGGYFGTVVGM
jgi:hypothetical protein